MSGYVGDLTGKQSETLKQFRENVCDILKDEHDDHYLLRWLRARCFDLKKSEKMLRESLKWREENGADTILTDWTPPELLLTYYPGGLFGSDKQGHPIYIEPVGYADPKGLLQSVTKTDIIKYKIRDSERILQAFRDQSAKHNRHIEGLIIILDLEKYGLRHLWKPALDIYTQVLTIFEANYPETLHKTYVVNAPKIFPIAYNLTKPFLSADTKAKVHILGKNWKQRLLEVIDADQLPVHWGGTATDPDGDPYCRSQVCMGGEIPPHHYTNHLDNFDMSQFTTTTIGRGSSLELDFPIQRTNTILRWQFFTESSDVCFSVVRHGSIDAGEGEPQSASNAKDVKEIVKPCRVNSHLIPESGSLVCAITGTYVIKFDNSYSWLKTKKLSYLIEVLPPGDLAELHTSPSFAMPRGDSAAELSMD